MRTIHLVRLLWERKREFISHFQSGRCDTGNAPIISFSAFFASHRLSSKNFDRSAKFFGRRSGTGSKYFRKNLHALVVSNLNSFGVRLIGMTIVEFCHTK